MTRRQWLAKNPPPEPSGALFDRAAELDAQGKVQEAARVRAQAAGAAVRCALHPDKPLYRHRNRMEDLFVCPQGPHFLLWTQIGARAQLVPLATKLELPDLDSEMR